MNIEFQTPYKKVTEKLIGEIRKELLELSHLNNKISRAEVILREENSFTVDENKVCEIRLNLNKDNLLVHTRKESFEKASKENLKELKHLLNKQEKKTNEVKKNSLVL